MELNQVRESYDEIVKDFELRSEEELVAAGGSLLNRLKNQVGLANEMFPPKKSIFEIAFEFRVLLMNSQEEGKDIYRYGIENAWLQERLDISALKFPEDLPYYARIGIGIHSGRVGVVDDMLLKDAFYLLVLAEKAYSDMLSLNDKHVVKGPREYHEISVMNSNVSTYSRLCITSFYSFVEAFVNGIGQDFMLRNRVRLGPKEIETLSGKKEGRFLGLETKMEKFQTIIRSDKKTPIVLSDDNQVKEPFKTFKAEAKEIRDSAMHYSIEKVSLLRSPQEWLDRARNLAKLMLKVAQEFWLACYASRPLPHYLDSLEYEYEYHDALKRLSIKG